MKMIMLPYINNALVFGELKKFITSQILSNKKDGAVIGLSGGVDSTLSAAITKAAIDDFNLSRTENDPYLYMVGLIISCELNSEDSAVDAINLAHQLGIEWRHIDIQDEIDLKSFRHMEFLSNKLQFGNMISRTRAGVIHDVAGLSNLLIIGTGNWGEDYCLGYYTRMGDGAVDISPIGLLPKRLVREMAAWLGYRDIAEKEPTAELEENQTDFFDLGYSYDLNEIVIQGSLQGLSFDELCKHPQIVNKAIKEMEFYSEKFGQKKFSSVSEMLKDMFERLVIAKKKASWICPVLPDKITTEYR